MTDRAWLQVEQYLDASWPSKAFDEATADVYRQELGHLEYGTVMAAIRAAALKGNTAFRPAPLAIVAELLTVAGRPVLDGIVSVYRRSLTVGRRDPAAGLQMVAGLDPVAGLVISEIGYKQFGLEQIDDPDHGGAVRHRICQVIDRATSEHAANPALTAGKITRRLKPTGPHPIGNVIDDQAQALRPAELPA